MACAWANGNDCHPEWFIARTGRGHGDDPNLLTWPRDGIPVQDCPGAIAARDHGGTRVGTRSEYTMPYPTSTAGRILVVDDQQANLRVVGALLSRHGYEVATASTGDEALQSILQRAPDLLLLDMMMPGMDGFSLLAEIKRHAELQSMPVVFLTAAQDRDLLLRAFDAGAVDYVTKPFMP